MKVVSKEDGMETEELKVKDQWALVELFGHSRIAGKISEHTLGGCSFVRVDVPENGTTPGFTKLYGQGAIYAISFVSEEIARGLVKRLEIAPVQSYELPMMISYDSDDDEAGHQPIEPEEDEIPF
jgi:hypothetical protein